MSDKTNIDDIVGLVKTDEEVNGVEEVRKLRGRLSDVASENWEIKYTVGDCKLMPDDGRWKQVVAIDDKGNRGWIHVSIVDVPVKCLIYEWEHLINELSNKEVELSAKKEEYARKEFEIVFKSDIDFKGLYGSTSEKVRKQHASDVLKVLNHEIEALEFSVNWIKQYIPLLREILKYKRQVRIFGE